MYKSVGQSTTQRPKIWLKENSLQLSQRAGRRVFLYTCWTNDNHRRYLRVLKEPSSLTYMEIMATSNSQRSNYHASPEHSAQLFFFFFRYKRKLANTLNAP